MAYVEFNDKGYEYFNEGHHVLFSEKNAHEFLFQYVTEDLSGLPELFKQYISQRIDTSTFTLTGCSGDNTSIEQMQDMLIAAHPYYKHEVRRILTDSIGNYFNDLLLYTCIKRKTLAPNFSIDWYKERITVLFSSLLAQGDSAPEDFYWKYRKQIGEGVYTAGIPDSEIETAVFNVPQEQPVVGLVNEIRTQKAIYNMLYFLLDMSAHGLEELTLPQRIWLYDNIVMDNIVGTNVSKHISFHRPILYGNDHDYSQEEEVYREIYDRFSSLRALSGMNVGRDGIPENMSKDLSLAIDYAKTVTANKPYEIYEINNLYQLLYLEIWSMIQNKTKIRKCRHCGKYFVAATRRIVYCDRIDESGMRCSAIGYQQAFQKKMEDDEPLQMYNRAYKTHHARLRKGTMTKDGFQLWCDEAKLKLEKARAGELDIGRFQEWLKK